MTTTPKGETNKKWTSNDDYRDNYDKIFGKKEEIKEEESEECPVS